MADTNGSTTKSAVARRDWIDAKGNPVDAGDASATGFRYLHIPTAKRLDPEFDPKTDEGPQEAIFEIVTLTEPMKTMGAIFGLLTLAGNIASTATNPKSGGDENANPIPDLVARFERMAQGVWAGERGAAQGPRYNAEALAKAIAKVKNETDHNPYLAKINAKEKVTIKGKGSILYAAYAMKNKDVEREYNSLAGVEAVVVSASDL